MYNCVRKNCFLNDQFYNFRSVFISVGMQEAEVGLSTSPCCVRARCSAQGHPASAHYFMLQKLAALLSPS